MRHPRRSRDHTGNGFRGAPRTEGGHTLNRTHQISDNISLLIDDSRFVLKSPLQFAAGQHGPSHRGSGGSRAGVASSAHCSGGSRAGVAPSAHSQAVGIRGPLGTAAQSARPPSRTQASLAGSSRRRARFERRKPEAPQDGARAAASAKAVSSDIRYLTKIPATRAVRIDSVSLTDHRYRYRNRYRCR